MPEEAPPPPFTQIEREGYVEFRLATAESLEELKGPLREMVRICTDRRPSRVLVDFSTQKIKPTTLQRYEIGMIGAGLTTYVGRVAVLAQPEFIDPAKFGLLVAQNRGLPAEIFNDRAEALAWLLE